MQRIFEDYPPGKAAPLDEGGQKFRVVGNYSKKMPLEGESSFVCLSLIIRGDYRGVNNEKLRIIQPLDEGGLRIVHLSGL